MKASRCRVCGRPIISWFSGWRHWAGYALDQPSYYLEDWGVFKHEPAPTRVFQGSRNERSLVGLWEFLGR